MSAEAKVINQGVIGVVILPMSAIQFDDNNNPYVLIKDGAKTPQQSGIKIGINNGVHAEIKSGVKPNDTVLVPPAVKSSIALITIVQGATGSVTRQISSLGANKISIQAMGTRLKQGLSEKDLEQLSQVNYVDGVMTSRSCSV